MTDNLNSPKNKVKRYACTKLLTDNQILDAAAEILACKYVRKDAFTSSQATKDFLRFKLGNKEHVIGLFKNLSCYSMMYSLLGSCLEYI